MFFGQKISSLTNSKIANAAGWGGALYFGAWAAATTSAQTTRNQRLDKYHQAALDSALNRSELAQRKLTPEIRNYVVNAHIAYLNMNINGAEEISPKFYFSWLLPIDLRVANKRKRVLNDLMQKCLNYTA